MIRLRNGEKKSLNTVVNEVDILSAKSYSEDYDFTVPGPDVKFLRWTFRTFKTESVKHYGIRIDYRTRNACPLFVNYKEDKETRDEDLATIANIHIEKYPPAN